MSKLDELERLEREATGAPWNPLDMDLDTSPVDPPVEPPEDERELFWSVCSQAGDCCDDCPRDTYPLHCHECVTPGAYVSKENAALIAATRNALPSLLACARLVRDMAEDSPFSQLDVDDWISRARRIMRDLEGE